MSEKLSGDFSKYSIVDFLKELGSSSPSPGGGTAAALIGAIGTALIQKVFNINDGRRAQTMKSVATNLALNEILNQLEQFGQLMRRDAEAFLELSRFSREQRQGALYQETLKRAANVPLEIARLTHQAMLFGEAEIDRTNRWLASDLAEAGILLEASFRSARLNVEINLTSIQDADYVKKTKTELDELDKKVTVSKTKLLGVLSRG